MPQEILNIILSAVSVIVVGLASWGVTLLTNWITSKMKDKKAAGFLTKILGIIADAVKQIYQQFVEALKNEGKFNKEAQEKAKEGALKIIKEQLTPELTEFIKNNYGDATTWISNQIEVALYNLKNK